MAINTLTVNALLKIPFVILPIRLSSFFLKPTFFRKCLSRLYYRRSNIFDKHSKTYISISYRTYVVH